MSGYNFPTSGGLTTTFKGTPIGVWIQDMGPPGIALIAARLDPASGWLAFYSHGPQESSDFQAEITAAGGIVAWLKTLLAAINAAFAKVFGTNPAPAPGPAAGFSIDAVNQALASSFTLSNAAATPIISAKPGA